MTKPGYQYPGFVFADGDTAGKLPFTEKHAF